MTEAASRQRSRPTTKELSEATGRLVAEIDAAFATDRWAILDTGTPQVKWRVYDGAGLRYCAQLLRELGTAADAGLEYAVRTLARNALEATVLSLYIHFGGHEALTAVAQAAKHSLEGLQEEANQINGKLADDRKQARKRLKRVQARNAHIARRNLARPDLPPTELIPPPYVPQLAPRHLDHVTALIAGFGSLEAKPLSVSQMVDQLSEWAPRRGIGQESLRPMYLDYRILSTIGTHASMHVLDELFIMGHYVRIADRPAPSDAALQLWDYALYYTSFIAERVLGAAGCPTPESTRVRTWSQPRPDGQASWRAEG
jgi:hypothetical protein